MDSASDQDVKLGENQVRKLQHSLSFQVGVGLAFFLAIILISTFYVVQTRGKEVFVEQAQTLNEEVGHHIVLNLRERLSRAESLTRALANLGVTLDPDPAQFKQLVPEILRNTGMDELVAGGGIWPAPFAFDKNTERRSFFWGKDSLGNLQYFDDYNDLQGNGYHNEEWYVPATYLKPGEVYWSKSYMDPYSREPMVTCTVPMWRDGRIVGVATVDLKLLGLSEFMSEQAKVTGGYAFAVDRNFRLLSTPKTGVWDNLWATLRTSEQSDYPTLFELQDQQHDLKEMVQNLSQISIQTSQQTSMGQETLEALANEIANNSYQVDPIEAIVIARQLAHAPDPGVEVGRFHLEEDPLLREATSINVFDIHNLGWKVIVSLPAHYTNDAIAYITQRMLGLLLLLVILSATLFVLYFNRAFLQPVNLLTRQVRRLIRNKDYETKLEIGKKDEVGELARCFNVRADQLREALERVKAQNHDLEEARAEAENANASKSIFLASMSHEIRTPMNAIIGMSEILSRMELENEQASYIKTINSSGQSLLSLINDIMDYSKVEAGKLELESIPFDLRASLDDCADLIGFQCEEKSLDFVYYVSPAVPQKVLGDPSRIRQVVLNLLGNAVKFTSEGFVELWVDSRERTEDGITLSLRVKDTGIGIPIEKQASLFAPFKQVDSSTTREYGGTGLGLTISKSLAELMGGDISFESKQGVGSTFLFDLRLGASATEASSSSNVMSLGYHFLALVTDPEQKKVVERYAASMGYQFRAVNTAERWLSALRSLEGQPVVSLVWELSLLGDFKVLSQSAHSSSDPHKLLVVSSIYQQNEVDTSELKGAFQLEFVSTPLKYSEFVQAIQNLMNHRPVAEFVQSTPEEEHSELKAKSPSKPIKAPKKVSGDLAHYASKRILVAEDNPVNQQIIMLQLEGLGLSADLAQDGQEAVEAVEAVEGQAYDLVLMDWQMPRKDGLQATKEIRQFQSGGDVVIIAVTANAMSGDIDTCLNAGMDDYIGKPVRIDELSSKLAKWLKQERRAG